MKRQPTKGERDRNKIMIAERLQAITENAEQAKAASARAQKELAAGEWRETLEILGEIEDARYKILTYVTDARALLVDLEVWNDTQKREEEKARTCRQNRAKHQK